MNFIIFFFALSRKFSRALECKISVERFTAWFSQFKISAGTYMNNHFFKLFLVIDKLGSILLLTESINFVLLKKIIIYSMNELLCFGWLDELQKLSKAFDFYSYKSTYETNLHKQSP